MDFDLLNNFHFVMLYPKSQEAKQWVSENLPSELQRLGNGIYVEGRQSQAIQGAGLKINFA